MSNSSHFLSKQNSQQPKQFRGGEKKVMKKSLSLLVAIAMVFSMFATLVSADGKAAGQKLQDLGIIKGTSDGLDENKEWLRQDVTVLLSRLLNAEAEAKAHANTHGFADLDSKFYNGYVSWAKEKGYFNGETDTRFGVGNPITNQQFAAVLLRVLKVDVEYAEAFEKAVELELVSADLNKTANAVRGDIYEALVKALDFKIDGKKLGTILGLKGYEVTDLEVEAAKGINQKTVVVEFNKEIASVNANNFSVKRADNDSVQIIQNVTVSGKTATIALVDNLVADQSYIVTVSNVADLESASKVDSANVTFSYTKTAPASISFAATTIEQNKELKVVIKDAQGNDITANYASTDIEAVSSAAIISQNPTTGVISAGSLNGAAEAYAVVSAKLKGTEIATGNVIVYVKSSLTTANSIGKVTLGSTTDPELSIFKGTLGATLVAEILDSNNQATSLVANGDPYKANFRSLSPTVLVVDQTTGAVQPIATGSATVVISGTIGGKTVSKSVVVTVKDDAKVSALSADKASVNVVLGSNGVDYQVKLTVKDQYGNKVAGNGILNVTASTAGIVAVPTTLNYTNGEVTLTLPAGTAVKGSTVLTFKESTNANVAASVTVNVVEKAAFAGYAVDISDLTLDVNTNTSDSNKKNPSSTTVKVYEKDINGNYINAVAAGVSVEAPKADIVTINGNTITAAKAGTEVVTVKVNGVSIGSYTFTVVNTTASISKVTQNVNAITVGNSDSGIFAKLFGTNGAFSAYNQYGSAATITASDVAIYSGNNNLVTVSNDKVITSHATNDGTVLLTVVIAGQVFTINVVVQ